MEERKRPLNDNTDAAPPSKKQATSANGAGKIHPDHDMPWKDDLEKIQKDAILRQLNEYKRERKDLESALADLRSQAKYHDDHLRTIDAWTKQLIDEINLRMADDADQMVLDSTAWPSMLHFSDLHDLESHLHARAADIKLLVARLFGRDKSLSPETEKLTAQLTRVLATEKEHLAELEKLRAEVKELDDRLQTASLRYMVAEKKLDRAKSVTAAKLDKGLFLGGARKQEEDSNAVKREDGQVNGVVDHGEELAELEAEIKKTTAVSEKQKDQIAALEQDNAQLNTKVTELMTKSAILNDEDYSKTELFKQLKQQHDDAVKKLNDLEALNTELKDENSRIQSDRSTYQAQLEAESRAVVAEKESALNQAHNDLSRVRNNRDELLADREIKKSQIDERAESLKRLKDLTAAHEERIQALESENERLTSQTENVMSVSSELDSMSAEDVRAKLVELEKKYSLLNGELVSMQNAYQKAQKLAKQNVLEQNNLEEKAARLSAEKAKADQKYFAAMKSKETREAEVRTLRLQTTKSSEIVAQVKEAEAAAKTLVQNLERQLVELKAALTNKTNEHRTTSSQTTTQASEIARLNSQITELKQVMTAKDNKLATSSTACRTAEVEVETLKASLSDVKKSLEAWKSKSGQSEQYELLRTFAYCTVCKKELKNTVIKTCGHTFCNNCVDKVVQLRSRKCPICGKPFGNNDHMRIVL